MSLRRSAITGPIDALFNCAGVSAGSGRSALDVYTVNFLGIRHLTELLVPRIIAGGAVATIASLRGLGWERNLAAIREVLGIDSFSTARPWAAQHPELTDPGGYGSERPAPP